MLTARGRDGDRPAISRRLQRLIFILALAVALSSFTCASSTSPNPCGLVADPPATYDHVLWIWMENHTYSQVIGKPGAAYTTRLARQCGTATNYSSIGSPSLPNYLGATAGSTFDITDDDAPSEHELVADNLFRQVRVSGRTAMSYEEGMPENCRLTDKGAYAVKHNPAAYFTGEADRDACTRDDVPMGTTNAGALADALDNDTLPAFSMVTPDLCHDTHDCPVSQGDDWLQSWLPTILSSRAYAAHRMAVIVVYDDYTPIPNVFISPSIVPGTVTDDAFDHYSLLRTTEEMLGISALLGAAADAPSMRAAFHM